MIYDLQKASVLKRISAGILDFIIVMIVATGFFFLLSAIFNYDQLNSDYTAYYEEYKEIYGFDFREVTLDTYNGYTQEQKLNYDTAYAALTSDQGFVTAYNLVINTTLLVVTFGILLAVMIVEFFVPLFLKNGQTVGKKVFGICLMSTNGVKVSNRALFIRTLLGKFTIETMIPVYFIIMLLFGNANVLFLFLGAALIIAQLLIMIVTKTNSLIHDLMSYTVVVDKESQMIFETYEELIKYKEEHAKGRVNSIKTF